MFIFFSLFLLLLSCFWTHSMLARLLHSAACGAVLNWLYTFFYIYTELSICIDEKFLLNHSMCTRFGCCMLFFSLVSISNRRMIHEREKYKKWIKIKCNSSEWRWAKEKNSIFQTHSAVQWNTFYFFIDEKPCYYHFLQ